MNKNDVSKDLAIVLDDFREIAPRLQILQSASEEQRRQAIGYLNSIGNNLLELEDLKSREANAESMPSAS